MMEFTISTDQIVWFCGFVTAIWGFLKIIKEVKKPSEDLKKQVEQNTFHLDNDNKRIKDLEETNKLILQCLLVSINHDITGNGVDEMKELRDKIQTYLITK